MSIRAVVAVRLLAAFSFGLAVRMGALAWASAPLTFFFSPAWTLRRSTLDDLGLAAAMPEPLIFWKGFLKKSTVVAAACIMHQPA